MDLQPIITSLESLRLVLGQPPAATIDGSFKLDDYDQTILLRKQLAQLRAVLDKATAYSAQYQQALDKQCAAQKARIMRSLENKTMAITQGDQKQVVEQPAKKTTLKHCEVTPGIFLQAIVVSSFAQVAQTGDLYYLPHCDHFAMKLNGKLFHGNVGTVYCSDRPLEKVKDCKFAHCANDPCDFYHDPTKHAGKKDRRNYVANSWLYVPPDARKQGSSRGRKIGSKEELAADLAQCTPEESAKFRDQVFHDLLCAMLT